MLLIRHSTRLSLQKIGRYFGKRDHSTVLHAIQQAARVIAKEPLLHRAQPLDHRGASGKRSEHVTAFAAESRSDARATDVVVAATAACASRSASASALIDLAVSTAEPEPATLVTLMITSKCSLPEPSRTGGQMGIRRTRPNAPSATLTATTMPPCQKPSLN